MAVQPMAVPLLGSDLGKVVTKHAVAYNWY